MGKFGGKHEEINQSENVQTNFNDSFNMSSILEEIENPMDNTELEVKSPYEESDGEDDETQLGSAYAEANPEECMYLGEPEEVESNEDQGDSGIPADEVLELSQPTDFNKMKFQDHIRCRLCACNTSEAHTPPFFRSCTFFRGQIPQKIQQRCCGGFHSALTPGTTCPVVKALGPRTYRPVYARPLFRNRNQQGQRPPNQNRQPQSRPMQQGQVQVARRPPFQQTQNRQVF
jgi:hypothetical protein